MTKKYVVLDKKIGETPLVCVEKYRVQHQDLQSVPLAYAGRLDPMASGKLLVLIGDECKKQVDYHKLDKEYRFSVLFGIESDTQDVLGRLYFDKNKAALKHLNNHTITLTSLSKLSTDLIGEIRLPYPIFSSKTVQGKPLHTWTLENRLNEIEIPTKKVNIYDLKLKEIILLDKTEVVKQALKKINSFPPVTDPRKIIGNDFRRADVRKDWQEVLKFGAKKYYVANFICTASSGTYMRTLASLIAKKSKTVGLAWSIHRTKLGYYDSETDSWKKIFI